jgi:hypothetical protein
LKKETDMKILTSARCVTDNARISEAEALETCTPSVIAVDCSRGIVSGMVRGALENAMRVLADCSPGYRENRVLMYKMGASADWITLTGDALDRAFTSIPRYLEGTSDGVLYITLPNYGNVEIYKIEEV